MTAKESICLVLKEAISLAAKEQTILTRCVC